MLWNNYPTISALWTDDRKCSHWYCSIDEDEEKKKKRCGSSRWTANCSGSQDERKYLMMFELYGCLPALKTWECRNSAGDLQIKCVFVRVMGIMVMEWGWWWVVFAMTGHIYLSRNGWSEKCERNSVLNIHLFSTQNKTIIKVSEDEIKITLWN